MISLIYRIFERVFMPHRALHASIKLSMLYIYGLSLSLVLIFSINIGLLLHCRDNIRLLMVVGMLSIIFCMFSPALVFSLIKSKKLGKRSPHAVLLINCLCLVPLILVLIIANINCYCYRDIFSFDLCRGRYSGTLIFMVFSAIWYIIISSYSIHKIFRYSYITSISGVFLVTLIVSCISILTAYFLR